MRKTRRLIRRIKRKLRRARESRRRRAVRFLVRLLGKDRRILKRIKLSHREGVDCSYGRPDPEALLDAGKTFIGRYYTPTSGMKLTREEAEGWHEHGIDIFSMWEFDNEAAKHGAKQGTPDASEACKMAEAAGQPKGTAIYMSADFETTGPAVHDYFEAAKAVIIVHGYRPGGYGRKIVIEYLFDQHLIAYGCQTYAWSDHEWDDRAQLRQVLINLPEDELEIGGATVDYCKSTAVDFGQW